MRKELVGEIRGLETRLLTGEARASAAELSGLLAEEFCEFGASGRVFDKDAIIRDLGREDAALEYAIEDCAVRLLGVSAALATYRLTVSGAESRTSLRSSIWVRRDDHWQVVFHQGTPVSPDTN